MLIDLTIIKTIINKIPISGALHIGAHNCEEMHFYQNILGLQRADVVWIEAMEDKVIQNKKNGIPNIYNAVITDKDDDIITFNISNNGESSSVLDFDTHLLEHPTIKFIDKIKKNTITVDTFFERNNIDPSKYNFWNFDIQGAELLALKGAKKSITHANVLYLEVNSEHLYKGCALIDEIDEFLDKCDFVRIVTKMTRHGWGDALYIKKQHLTHVSMQLQPSAQPIYQPRVHSQNYIFYNELKNTFKTIFHIGCQDQSIYNDFHGEVHYFEPVKRLCELCKKAPANNIPGIYNNFLLSTVPIYNKTNDKVNSKHISGKDYMKEHNISHIELLDIDMPNYELHILTSFGDRLHNIKIIEIRNIYEIEKLNDIMSLLKVNGFSNFSYLTEYGPEPLVIPFVPMNMVCINDFYSNYA